jgi:hypothetical protein
VASVESALQEAGFTDVLVRSEELELSWPSADEAVQGVTGTPYGPVIAGLDGAQQSEIMADVRRRVTGDDGNAVSHRTTAVLGRGTAS